MTCPGTIQRSAVMCLARATRSAAGDISVAYPCPLRGLRPRQGQFRGHAKIVDEIARSSMATPPRTRSTGTADPMITEYSRHIRPEIFRDHGIGVRGFGGGDWNQIMAVSLTVSVPIVVGSGPPPLTRDDPADPSRRSGPCSIGPR